MPYTTDQLVPGQQFLLMTQTRPGWTLAGAVDIGITTATLTPFDHAALVVQSPSSDIVLVEALETVTVSPADKYKENGWLFSVPQMTPYQSRLVSQAALSKVGQFYGWQEVGIDAVRLFGHLRWTPPWDSRQLDCSGLVAWAFWEAGIVLSYAPFPSPADLANSGLPVGERPWWAAYTAHVRPSAH